MQGQCGCGPSSSSPQQPSLAEKQRAMMMARGMRTDPANIVLEEEDDESVAGAGEPKTLGPGLRHSGEEIEGEGQHLGTQRVPDQQRHAPTHSNLAEAGKQQATTPQREPCEAAGSRQHLQGRPPEPPWRGHRGNKSASSSHVELKPAANKRTKPATITSGSDDDAPDPLFLAVQSQVEAATASPPGRHQRSRPSDSSARPDFAPPKSRPLGPPPLPQDRQQKGQQELRSKAPGPKKPQPENSCLQQLVGIHLQL